MPPTYRLCKLINQILKDVLDFKPKYGIKNSFELTKKLTTLKIPANCKLLSLDINSLFTSIPIDELLNILDNLLDNSKLSSEQKSDLKKLVQICLQQNYFKFNNKFYMQLDGLPMGSPLSPLLSEIFMDDWERKFIDGKHKFQNNIYFYARYVDDIFCIWNGTERQMHSFLSYINSLNNKITFTMEIEKEGNLNFLDLSINFNKESQKLEYNIYRKPTHTDVVINNFSFQSQKIKHAAFHSLIHRLLNIPLSIDAYKKELEIIKTIATNNGYNTGIIDNIVKKHCKKRILNSIYTQSENSSNKNWSKINYLGPVSDRIASALKRENLNITLVNKVSLRTLLVNNKQKLDILDKSGVYEIKCICDCTYIGQSGRKIGVRIKEHEKSIKDMKRNTGFSTHCIDKGHKPIFNDVRLLQTCNKGKKLNALEKFYINKALKNNNPIVNDLIDTDISPIIKAVL